MASKDSSSRKIPSAVRRALADSARDVSTWRKLRGLTQVQLADRAGVGLNTLRRLESGDGSVTLENTLRILRALGILGDVSRALDPYESDIGRLRSDERLPERVHPRRLG